MGPFFNSFVQANIHACSEARHATDFQQGLGLVNTDAPLLFEVIALLQTLLSVVCMCTTQASPPQPQLRLRFSFDNIAGGRRANRDVSHRLTNGAVLEALAPIVLASMRRALALAVGVPVAAAIGHDAVWLGAVWAGAALCSLSIAHESWRHATLCCRCKGGQRRGRAHLNKRGGGVSQSYAVPD